jgi:hypothetical protein
MPAYLKRLLDQQTEAVDFMDIPGLEKARAGRRLMQLSLIVNALRIPITCLALLLMTAMPAFAQGPIFNGSPSTFANMVREGLKLLAILLFCGGAVFTAWTIINVGRKNEWTNPLLGAIGCFGFGTFVAVLYSIAQGKPVDVGTDF